jgi:hypothetical protein
MTVAAAVGGVVLAASAAWACTDFTRIDQVVPANQSPVPTAAVRGSGADAGALVQLRWNDVNGPVIGSARADATGAYDLTATLPADVPAGVYTLVASDGHHDVGRAPYEVAAPSADPATPVAKGKLVAPAGGLSSGVETYGIAALAGAGAVVTGGLIVASTRRRRALATIR